MSVADHGDQHALFVRVDGRRRPTRLLVALGAFLVTDLIFAADSLPAILGVTSSRFIVFAANVFAVLGMKAIYTVLTHVMERFARAKTGLSLILVFVGVKLATPGKLSAWVSLAVVVSLLVAAECAAALSGRGKRL